MNSIESFGDTNNRTNCYKEERLQEFYQISGGYKGSGVGKWEDARTLFFKSIDKDGRENDIKKCFCDTWYDKKKDGVLLLWGS